MKQISGHTQHFAVLGYPIGHTLSPLMHNTAIEELGMDAIYTAHPVPPEKLMEVLSAFDTMNYGGVNLTVPLKEAACNVLKRLDRSAEVLGAVNTVEFTDAGMRGHNTDGYGFMTAVQETFELEIKDQSIYILGTGGAGRAVALTCALAGCKHLILTDTAPDRPERVKKEIHAIAADCEVQTATPDDIALCQQAQLIVQATPVGMKPEDPSALAAEAFTDQQRVFDLIYMYPETAFMAAAASRGARTANGLDMLLYQGVRAFEIWTGTTPPVDTMRNALEEAVYSS